MFFSLRGMPDKNLNIWLNRSYEQNKLWHKTPWKRKLSDSLINTCTNWARIAQTMSRFLKFSNHTL